MRRFRIRARDRCWINIASMRSDAETTNQKFTDQRKATVAEALARLPGPQGERFVTVFEHGSLLVEVYAPRGADPQKPHTRDEVYVVVEGSGEFLVGESRQGFGPGDLLFAAAGETHRFENFSDDLVVWVIFYGPEGGEATTSASFIEK
jgi:mannose-6-phosphate isomerase-like protein (cupin superfamily)